MKLAQASKRSLTLIELMVAMVLGAIVILPFTIFIRDMVRMSLIMSQKMALSSNALTAVLGVQAQLMAAKEGKAFRGGAPLAANAVGDEIRFTTGNEAALSRALKATNGNLLLTENGGTTTLASNVSDFSAREIAVNEFEITVTIRNSNSGIAVTMSLRVLLLNVSVN